MSKAPEISKLCKEFEELYVNFATIHAKIKTRENQIFDYVKKNGPITENGHYYYIRREYTYKSFDVYRFKKEQPDLYAKYLRNIEVQPKLFRRLVNVK